MRVTGVRCFMAALLVITAARVGGAQAANSNASTLNLGWGNPESINVNINFTQGVILGNFTQGANNASPTPTTTPIPLTVNYNGLVNRTKVQVWAYFVDGARALVNSSGGAVTADKIQATVQGGGSPTTFTTPSPFSSSSVLLNSTDSLASATGSLNLAFTMSILGNGYPAGFYQGVLLIQAQAI